MDFTLVSKGLRSAKELTSRMFSFDLLAKNVETGVYAATIRGILLYNVHCAQKLVTYGDLATATNTLPKGGQLAQALQKIAEDDHHNGRALSTAIVVSGKGCLPGEGFFKQALSLGYSFEETPEGKLLFWQDQLHKLDVTSTTDQLGEAMAALNKQAANPLEDTEIGVLSNIWQAPPDLGAPIAAYRSLSASVSQDGFTSSEPPKVISPMSLEEQRTRAFGQGTVRIPPQELKEGDTVLLYEKGRLEDRKEVTVVAVNIKINVRSSSDIQREVTWTDNEGRTYASPGVGSHLIVKRPPVVVGPASALPSGETKTRKPRVRTKKRTR